LTSLRFSNEPEASQNQLRAFFFSVFLRLKGGCVFSGVVKKHGFRQEQGTSLVRRRGHGPSASLPAASSRNLGGTPWPTISGGLVVEQALGTLTSQAPQSIRLHLRQSRHQVTSLQHPAVTAQSYDWSPGSALKTPPNPRSREWRIRRTRTTSSQTAVRTKRLTGVDALVVACPAPVADPGVLPLRWTRQQHLHFLASSANSHFAHFSRSLAPIDLQETQQKKTLEGSSFCSRS
jgi:hypothetical protein